MRHFGRLGFRRISGFTMLAAGVLLLAMAFTDVLEGRPAKYVHVRWAPDLDADARAELEWRFSLARPEHLEGTTFGYELLNESRWNLRRLVRHPAVQDTHDIDRQRFLVAPTAPAGEGGLRNGVAWRWGIPAFVAYAPLTAAAFMLAGALTLLSSQQRTQRVRALLRAPSMRGRSVLKPLRLPMPPPFLLLLVLVAVRVIYEGTSTSDSSVWFPRLEEQAWAPLEVVVAAVLLLAGASIAFSVAARLIGGSWRTLVPFLVLVWIFPFDASEAGVLLYAIVLWACHRYIAGQAPEGVWILTGLTFVVAALRVDHGLYVAIGVLAALLVRHLPDGAGAVRKAAGAYAASLAVIVLLFLPLGDVHGAVSRFGSRAVEAITARSDSRASSGGAAVEPNAQTQSTFNIRWAPEIALSQRLGKEQEHALAGAQPDPGDPSGRTWRYEWDGRTPDAVRRVLDDPAVEDTHGFDRSTGRYLAGPAGVERLSSSAADVMASLTNAARWLWVILPIAAAIRLVRRRLVNVAPRSSSGFSLGVLPALVLCLPGVWLVLRSGQNLPEVVLPALPALALVTAWVLNPSEPSDRRTSPQQAPLQWNSHAGLLAILAVFTVFLHLYVNADISNDHAGYLSMARQVVYGDWPIRDFRDDGSLLQIVLSAAMQKIGGFRLLGELVMTWVFFAVANGITYWLAFRLSASKTAAFAATALAALLIPRPYAYPKLFIYPLALLVLWRYVERPQVGRLVVVAAITALAFLFRIDHGVVLAATSALAIVLVRAPVIRRIIRDGAILFGALAAFMLPQLAYIVWSTELARYVESIVTFGSYADATREPWPFRLSLNGGLFTEMNGTVLLLDLFLVIAAIALVRAAVQAWRAWRRAEQLPEESLWVLITVAMWALMLPMLARGQYYTRIAEIGQPVAILGAWVAARGLSPRMPDRARQMLLGVVLAIVVVALFCRAPAARFIVSASDVFRGAPFQSQRLDELASSPPIDRFAPREVSGERWLVRYANLCTNPGDRLLVTWFGPEIFLFAGRPFAGDRWTYLPFDNSPEQQREVVERLGMQSVPIVFVDAAGYQTFSVAWPTLTEHLESTYMVAAEVRDRTRITRVLTRIGAVPSRRLEFANLPCFD